MKFAAIDFETANHSRESACAVGIVVFQDDQIIDSFYSLIKPPKGYGWFRDDFISVHGITHEDVRDAPTFAQIASAVFQRLTAGELVIAHNARFDLGILNAACGHFGIAVPPFRHACTRDLARRAWPELPAFRLDVVCEHIGHTFVHHNALQDAEAAGRVLLAASHTGQVLSSVPGIIPVKGEMR